MKLEDIINKMLKDPEYLAFYELAKAIQIDATYSLENFTWERFNYWDNLLNELKKDNKYERFDNKMQWATRVTIEDVANWLLRKSKEIGVQKALEILNKYNNSEYMEIYLIKTVMSSRPYDEYLFSNGVELLNQDRTSKINKKLSTDLLLDTIRSSVPTPYISSIFAYPVKKKIKHDNDGSSFEEDKDLPLAIEKIDNVKECLILATGLKGIHTMASKYLIPDNIPLVSSGKSDSWSFETFYLPSNNGPFIEKYELDEANRLLSKFQNLEVKFRESLKVSIERLNGYCSSSSYIERAINIRTCLETVFLKDNELTELTRTLALRASKLMSDEIEERKKMIKLIKDCYSITSKAVHRGNIAEKYIKNITKLDEVAEICRQVIIKKIERGYDYDWEEIELN